MQSIAPPHIDIILAAVLAAHATSTVAPQGHHYHGEFSSPSSSLHNHQSSLSPRPKGSEPVSSRVTFPSRALATSHTYAPPISVRSYGTQFAVLQRDKRPGQPGTPLCILSMPGMAQQGLESGSIWSFSANQFKLLATPKPEAHVWFARKIVPLTDLDSGGTQDFLATCPGKDNSPGHAVVLSAEGGSTLSTMAPPANTIEFATTACAVGSDSVAIASFEQTASDQEGEAGSLTTKARIDLYIAKSGVHTKSLTCELPSTARGAQQLMHAPKGTASGDDLFIYASEQRQGHFITAISASSGEKAWEVPQAISAPWRTVDICLVPDMNDDGRIDIGVLALGAPGSTTKATLCIFSGSGGDLLHSRAGFSGTPRTGLACSLSHDHNSDGIDDLLISDGHWTRSIRVLSGKSLVTLASYEIGPELYLPGTILSTFFDWDQLGAPDLLVASHVLGSTTENSSGFAIISTERSTAIHYALPPN